MPGACTTHCSRSTDRPPLPQLLCPRLSQNLRRGFPAGERPASTSTKPTGKARDVSHLRTNILTPKAAPSASAGLKHLSVPDPKLPPVLELSFPRAAEDDDKPSLNI